MGLEIAILRSSKSDSPELLDYIYRKEFGITQEQLENERYDVYITNLYIMKLLKLKEKKEIDGIIRP